MGKRADFILMVLTAIGCYLFTYFISNGDMGSTSTVYNLIFLGMNTLLYFIALMVGLNRIHRLDEYFRVGLDVIRTMKSEKNLSVSDKVSLLKGYEPIDNKLGYFLSDLKESQSGLCNIDDYINEDELAPIIRKWLLDLVPDVMTSLGILGTFVGLVWGMKSFNTSDFDVMAQSVSALMEGIKVAFLTSIYGLVMSIMFSYSMNKGYSKMVDSMQEYIDRFHNQVTPSAEKEAQDMMVYTQRGQYEALKSISMEFTSQMSSGLNASVAPTLQRIDQTLDNALTDIRDTQVAFLQEVGENYKKMGNSSDLNERMLQMIQESISKNEEVFEEQRVFFSKLLSVLGDGSDEE